MASFIDVSLTGYFTNIFLFLLVYAGVFALLSKLKILGENKNLGAVIAFVIALFVTLSEPVSKFIIFVLPWFFVIGLILLFFIFIGKLFGKTDKDIAWAFTWNSESPVITWVIIIVIIVLVIGFSQMFGQELLEQNPTYSEGESSETVSSVATSSINVGLDGNEIPTDTGEYSSNVLGTLIHPKILGMIVLLVTGLAAILLITKTGFIAHQ